MITLEAIREALLIIRVLGSNEAPDEDDAQTCLVTLNMMLRRWEANGLALGWNTVDDVNDPLPVPPEAEEAVVNNLAVKVAPKFGKQPSNDTYGAARSSLAALLRDNKVAFPLVMEGGSRLWGWYDIRSDQYYNF